MKRKKCAMERRARVGHYGEVIINMLINDVFPIPSYYQYM